MRAKGSGDARGRARGSTRRVDIGPLFASVQHLTFPLPSLAQVAKLLIIPFVCFLERFYMGRVFTREVAVAILLVIFGVGIVTLEDLRMDITPAGLMVAAVSVVSSGLQQIFVRSLQQKHRLSAHELLSNTAPVQAWTLLLAGPLIDRVVTTEWVTSYHVTPAAVLWLTISALLAVLVNVSQFMCLGRFSAVSFQVLGHSKTVLVLVGSWLFLGDLISTRKLLGMSLAVAGMVWYGSASAAAASSAVPRRPSSPRISALVEKDGDLPGDRAYAEARVGVPLDGGGKRDVV